MRDDPDQRQVSDLRFGAWSDELRQSVAGPAAVPASARAMYTFPGCYSGCTLCRHWVHRRKYRDQKHQQRNCDWQCIDWNTTMWAGYRSRLLFAQDHEQDECLDDHRNVRVRLIVCGGILLICSELFGRLAESSTAQRPCQSLAWPCPSVTPRCGAAGEFTLNYAIITNERTRRGVHFWSILSQPAIYRFWYDPTMTRLALKGNVTSTLKPGFLTPCYAIIVDAYESDETQGNILRNCYT
jgi:hypothetical protein